MEIYVRWMIGGGICGLVEEERADEREEVERKRLRLWR